MKVYLISEENHGHIGVAATHKAALQWLIASGWVGRYSEIWLPDENHCDGGRNMMLGELYGEDWEKQFLQFSDEQLENMGFYLHREDVIEEEN